MPPEKTSSKHLVTNPKCLFWLAGALGALAVGIFPFGHSGTGDSTAKVEELPIPDDAGVLVGNEVPFVERINALINSDREGNRGVQALESAAGRRLLREWGRAERASAIHTFTNVPGFPGGSHSTWQRAMAQIALGIKDREDWRTAMMSLAAFRTWHGDWASDLMNKFVEAMTDEDPNEASRLITEATLQEKPDPVFQKVFWPNHAWSTAIKLVENAHARGSTREGVDAALLWMARYPIPSRYADEIFAGVAARWPLYDVQAALDYASQMNSSDPNCERLKIHVVEGLARAERYDECIKLGLTLQGQALAIAIPVALANGAERVIPQLLAAASHKEDEQRLRSAIACEMARYQVNTAFFGKAPFSAAEDPDRLIEQLLAANAGATDKRVFRCTVAGELTSRDLEVSRRWLGSFPHVPLDEVNYIAGTVAEALTLRGIPARPEFDSDPVAPFLYHVDSAIEFVDGLSSGTIRDAIGYHLALTFGNTKPYGAHSSLFADFATRTANKLYRWNPIIAWAYVASITPDIRNGDATPAHLRRWMNDVRDQIGPTLAEWPHDDVLRDAALETYCRVIYQTNPARTAQYFKLMSDPVSRERLKAFLKTHGSSVDF